MRKRVKTAAPKAIRTRHNVLFDDSTKAKADVLAKMDNRSFNNLMTTLVIDEHARRFGRKKEQVAA